MKELSSTQQTPQAQGKEHVVWLDTVRLVAMFTVVCCHSADPFNFYTGGSTDDLEAIKFWGAHWHGASRYASRYLQRQQSHSPYHGSWSWEYASWQGKTPDTLSADSRFRAISLTDCIYFPGI